MSWRTLAASGALALGIWHGSSLPAQSGPEHRSGNFAIPGDVTAAGRTSSAGDATQAANPLDPSLLVRVFQVDIECFYQTSADSGVTWSTRRHLPKTLDDDRCQSPVVRAAPDGTFFYIAYESILVAEDTFISDVLVFRVSGDLASRSGPYRAIWRHERSGVGDNDKPWITVHDFGGTAANVYISLVRYDDEFPFDCHVVFSRSTDHGVSWPDAQWPALLASFDWCYPANDADRLLHGAQTVAAGNGHLLVCWYDSGEDGWGPAFDTGGKFDIVCRHSGDRGLTWDRPVRAVADEREETSYAMCPGPSLQQLWGTMAPSMALAPDGSVHIAYSRDPTVGSSDGECADVRYVSSARPPYDVWSSPVTIAGIRGSAQFFPTLTAQKVSGGPCRLDVTYASGQRSPTSDPNSIQDAYAKTSTDCGKTWGKAVRLDEAVGAGGLPE